MECVICKNGITKQGLVVFTLERKGVIVVFKNVPAQVCQNCGNFYITEAVTQVLLEKAKQSLVKGVEFEIINFNTAA